MPGSTPQYYYSSQSPATMAVTKRSSPTPQQNASTRDLKKRVIINLNKLSDRDTHAIATSELESIARNLSHDSFTPFLNCIYDTDSSEKSPVRKQCVRLLGFISQTHGDALSPFVSKMLANIVRRLRDSDSAVRQACIDAVTTMASQITKPPFSAFLKPLTEALLLEQDYNAQIGSALCLASAIEASPDPEPSQLQKLLPRLLKLLKAECFKAKPALLALIGSIAGVGGASSRNVLTNLVPTMVEFLSSEDWAARKAAAEALLKLAIVERDQLSEFKTSSLASFDARRFDKVKAVRETMNQMLEAWKDVPGLSDEVTQPSQSISSSRENASDGRFPPGPRSSGTLGFETPQTRKKAIPASRSPPPDSSSVTIARKRSPLKSNDSKSSPALFRKLDCKKLPDWKVEVAVPHASSLTVVCEDDIKKTDGGGLESGVDECNASLKPQTKRVLFNKNYNDKTHKFGGFRSGNRVVPLQDESSDSTVVVSNATEMYGNQKDNEDLSLIRKQLVQIENQQSSLLDLLQFIGSSQNGMRSLETRVHGLELALDEISYDLAMSTAKVSGTDSAGNTCCKLPGAEFLSSKFWRRTEGRYPSSSLSSSGGSLAAIRNVADKDGSSEPLRMDNWRFRLQRGGGGVIVNPLAEIHSDSTASSEIFSNRALKNTIYDLEGRQGRSRSGLDVASSVTS
ncbi:TORTIFOLIA1-like protein 4 isoform X2 [Telopea speciosissima]|uniref:TORTIFOLIA1-like protein 4 isoform X2 n=1 Tax=Telopea speciosissima TaxID=54955 RepID=UPI001CC7544A|nr:TORTIFOLIA1-like protein 4 isoform X2 [Telopea speciosissima]